MRAAGTGSSLANSSASATGFILSGVSVSRAMAAFR